MSSISPVSSAFQIECVSLADASEFELSVVRTKAAAWESIALQKAKQESNEKEIFSDAVDMAFSLQLSAKEGRSEMAENFYFLLCKDSLDKIQAIAFSRFSPDAITILTIITHPHNIRSSLNEKETGRVFGAGGKIVTYLKELMDKKRKIQRIALDALDSAVKFYQKMGFQFCPTVEETSGEKASKRMVLLRESIARSESSS